MTGIINLNTYRQKRDRIAADIEADLHTVDFIEQGLLAAAIQEGLIWLDVARQSMYQPLYCIQGGKI